MLVCPRCGAENPERARFCLECGAPLAPQRGGSEERRLVTVLFCDLAGFTARSDLADPEDVKALLRPFHARLKREVESFGGTLDKFIGDGALAVFGAPIAHEDDPERAVRAGLRIQEAILELNEEDPGLNLAARIGINTGEAVVSLGPGPQIGESVTGDVVNTASRLQAVAPVGGIVVGEPTFRATGDVFVYEQLEPVTVRGKSSALPIWRPLSARSRLVRDRTDTPFVGREDESAIVRSVYRRAVSGPAVQLLTVTGEAGVGKSRLIAEFADYLDDIPEITRWRQGRCLPYGEGVSFSALAEMVKAEAGILESDGPDGAKAKLWASVEALVEDPSERDWLFARLGPLVGLGEAVEDADQAQSFAAWRLCAEAMASQHTTVLVFEDLHWADQPMLEFIEHLVDWASQAPLIVICTARPELYDRRPSWGGGMRNAATLWLPPLSDAETETLLRELLPGTVLPADVLAGILERCGGIPLYAEEFVHMLFDRGYLEPGGGLGLPEGERIDLPDSVHALIGARLDTLPPVWKSLLQDAAVMGRSFWSGALAAIGGRDEPEVTDTLRKIALKELILPIRPSSVEGQAEYHFRHLFIRDVAYGQIPRAARVEKHLAAARWLEKIAGDRVTDAAELLAHHYSEALDLARATGGNDRAEELRPLARRFLVLAGDRARRLDAARAERYYRRAVELFPPGGAERARVLVQVAETASMQGRFEEARRDYEEAVADLRAAGDRLGLGEALGLFARACSRRGDVARSRELIEEAIAVLEAEPRGRELARVYNRKAGQLLLAGDFAECLHFSEKALDLARELDMDDEVVRALETRGASRSDLGDEGGLEDLREAQRLGLEAGLGVEVGLSYGNLAYQLWRREGPAAALPVWRDMRSFSETRGFATDAMWARLGELETLFDMGEWDTVLAMSHELVEWDRERGESMIGTYARLFDGWVLLRRGQTDAAGALVEEFLPRARRIEYAEHLAPALMIAAEVERAQGNLDRAAELVEEFAELTESKPDLRALFLPVAVRVLAAAGLCDRADQMVIEDDVPMSKRNRISVLTARAVLAEARSDAAGAAELYAEAARRWAEYGFPLEQGQTLVGQGRCLLRLGDEANARERLVEGRAVLARLGARSGVEEAERLLSRSDTAGA